VTAGASGASEPLARVAPEKASAGVAPASGEVAPGRVCLDCGAPLTGKFCAVCGQKDEPLKRGLKDLALEFFQHPLIDTKLWRSLVPLLLRPGALTEEYLAGRRTRYVRPLKLYLTVSVTFFALLVLLVPGGGVKIQVGSGASVHIGETKPHIGETKPAKPREQMRQPVRWLDERFQLQRKLDALEGPGAETFAQAVGAKTTERIPKMVFLLLPLSAVLFKLFWWSRYFVEHLVFSLHLHAYAFLAGMLLFPKWTPLTVVFLVWSSVYAALAFKRVYRQGWVKTLLKVAALTLAYTLLLSVAMLATALSALLTA
jgi:hypothetical protein